MGHIECDSENESATNSKATKPRKDWSYLPNWPRLMSVDAAAAYLSIGVSLFKRLVTEGQFPSPLRLGKGRIVWDRFDLDNAIESWKGSPTTGEWQV